LLQLSVIIVNYNVCFFLEQCLCSVKKAVSNIDAEIIVVDNASTDGSIKYLQTKFPDVLFIDTLTNNGFAKANNKGLQMAKGKFVLFLNPDTIVSENCLSNCISFLESHTNAGAIGVKMIDGSGNFLPESKRSFPTIISSFCKMSGLAFLFKRSGFFNRYALGNLNENKIHAVDVVAGAFMMVSRELSQQVGAFDEKFFMYGEDVDLSFRIHQKGFQNYYLGHNTIIHFKGESSRKQNIQFILSFYGAMIVFVKRHYPAMQAFLFSFFIRVIILFRIVLQKVLLALHQINFKKRGNYLEQVVLLGSENDCEKALHILQSESLLLQHTERMILPEHNFQLSVIINDLNQKKATAIIFCEGGLSYKQIISIVTNLSPKHKYYFFSQNSNSIISSYSKITYGQTIPEKNSYLA
jgi:N-acetylglucosaminyl-diphospho-decaprenol L-rhamnosyltransferase